MRADAARTVRHVRDTFVACFANGRSSGSSSASEVRQVPPGIRGCSPTERRRHNALPLQWRVAPMFSVRGGWMSMNGFSARRTRCAGSRNECAFRPKMMGGS